MFSLWNPQNSTRTQGCYRKFLGINECSQLHYFHVNCLFSVFNISDLFNGTAQYDEDKIHVLQLLP